MGVRYVVSIGWGLDMVGIRYAVSIGWGIDMLFLLDGD